MKCLRSLMILLIVCMLGERNAQPHPLATPAVVLQITSISGPNADGLYHILLHRTHAALERVRFLASGRCWF